LLHTIPERRINGTEEVRCATQHAVAIDNAGYPDTDRGHGVTTLAGVGPQEFDDITKCIDNVVEVRRRGGTANRNRFPGISWIKDDTEDLGPTDVDPESEFGHW
jgi:hypothetical protein